MKLRYLVPELLVEDLPATIAFYQDILGFETEVLYPQSDPMFAQLKKDGVRIKLYTRSEYEKEIPKLKTMKMGGSLQLYIESEGVKEFYTSIERKVKVIKPLLETEYGSIEFTIEDSNGYLLCFSESVS